MTTGTRALLATLYRALQAHPTPADYFLILAAIRDLEAQS